MISINIISHQRKHNDSDYREYVMYLIQMYLTHICSVRILRASMHSIACVVYTYVPLEPFFRRLTMDVESREPMGITRALFPSPEKQRCSSSKQ
jgi:hypothetical protein